MRDDALEGGAGRRQGPLRPALDLGHGQDQVRRCLVVLVDLSPLHRLRRTGEDIPSEFSHGLQPGGHGLHLGVVLVALPLLQRGDQGIHLALGLLIFNGEKHPGLDVHQLGGHGDELAGHLQIHLLPPGQPRHVLVADQGDGDVLDLHFVLAQQI